MRLDRFAHLLSLALLTALTTLGAAAGLDDGGATAETVRKTVRDFEQSLSALPTKEARIEATRKFFDGIKDPAAKIEAVGVFDDRYVYAVPKEAASEILGKLLKDADLKVRVRAADALGYVGKGGDHFDDLVALLKETDAEGTKKVVYAMGRARDKRFLPYLRDALKDPDLSVRQTVAFELTMYPAADVRGDINALLKDTEPVMRAAGLTSPRKQLGDDADTASGSGRCSATPARWFGRGRRGRSGVARAPTR